MKKRSTFSVLHKRNIFFIAIAVLCIVYVLITQQRHGVSQDSETTTILSGAFDKAMLKSDEEWKSILTPEQYHILREQGTEVPFTGALVDEHRKGTYFSVGCNEPVFRSEQKYESGTGWPSFWAPIQSDVLVLRKDTSFGPERIEVLDKCGGHLGHVFDDGPEPTGKRYCMNSVALKFVPDGE
jgi:peptide-methionine (R)-S-oxide reductase